MQGDPALKTWDILSLVFCESVAVTHLFLESGWFGRDNENERPRLNHNLIEILKSITNDLRMQSQRIQHENGAAPDEAGVCLRT